MSRSWILQHCEGWRPAARITRGRVQLAVGIVSRVITIGALLGFLVWSLEVAWGIRPWIMPAMEISRAWVYAAGPVGCVFMLLYAVRDLGKIQNYPR